MIIHSLLIYVDDDKEDIKPETHNLSEIKEEPDEDTGNSENKGQENEEHVAAVESSSDSESNFPDTQIKIIHFQGTK